MKTNQSSHPEVQNRMNACVHKHHDIVKSENPEGLKATENQSANQTYNQQAQHLKSRKPSKKTKRAVSRPSNWIRLISFIIANYDSHLFIPWMEALSWVMHH